MIYDMCSNLRRYSFPIAFLIFVMLVISNAFTISDQYHSFPSNNSISMVEQVNDTWKRISNNFATHDIHRNNEAFASSENSSSLATNNSNVNLSPLLDSPAEIPSRSNSIEYNARILCGTIVGEEGPLRPGHYNSDVNIFNRQNFPVSFFWKTVLTSDLRDEKQKQKQEEQNSNFILLALDPGNSISISCNDIREYLPANPNRNSSDTDFLEGVLTISVELDPSIQGALSSSLADNGTREQSQLLIPPSSNQELEPNANILSVDAIYTVNALKVASRELVLQLIDYSITKQDEARKIPSDMISKTLSVAVPIRTNETINPEKQVRDILMREYFLSPEESQGLNIVIRNLSLGVGALDDNHAISLQRINAYQPPP
jgi:hypothetical protein